MLLSIAALTLPIVPGQPQVIIPAGTFNAPNGSLKGQGPWTLSDNDGTALVDKANGGTDIVIDYEHQTLLSAQNGQPAPAAGWLLAGSFIWQPDVGVIATDVRWTTDAADMIQEGEYRYLSPVFSYTSDGIPIALLSVALTNTPALTVTQELAIAATNRGFSMSDQQIAAPTPQAVTPEPVTIVTHVSSPPPVAALSQPSPATSAASQHPMIAALTNQVTLLGADNLRLREELASLQRQLTDSAKNSLVTAALSTGRLMPGMEAWAMSMSMENLQQYVSTAQPIAALSRTQTGGVAPKTNAASTGDLCAEEIAICKQLKIPHDKFVAHRAAMRNPQ